MALKMMQARDERVVMFGKPWSEYERLLELRGDRSAPRIAFLDGEIEVMSPSRTHEYLKEHLGALLVQYCLESDIDVGAYGAWTLKKRKLKAGVEPDNCYIFSSHPQRKRRPDLAIEVVWTRGGIEKLEIYRRLNVPEVWWWKAGVLRAYALVRGRYVVRERSQFVPELDLEVVNRLAQIQPLTRALRELQKHLRRR